MNKRNVVIVTGVRTPVGSFLGALKDVESLKVELKDRFGRIPRSLLHLLKVAEIRIRAAGTESARAPETPPVAPSCRPQEAPREYSRNLHAWQSGVVVDS